MRQQTERRKGKLRTRKETNKEKFFRELRENLMYCLHTQKHTDVKVCHINFFLSRATCAHPTNALHCSGKLVLICSQDSTNPVFCARFWRVVFCCGIFCDRPSRVGCREKPAFLWLPVANHRFHLSGVAKNDMGGSRFCLVWKGSNLSKPLVVPAGERRKNSSSAGRQKDRCQGKHDKKCMIVWASTNCMILVCLQWPLVSSKSMMIIFNLHTFYL